MQIGTTPLFVWMSGRQNLVLFLILMLILPFSLQAQSYQKDPVLYNDKIVDAQNAIGREILTFVDFMGVAKQAVRHHGGITMVLRRLWQVMAFEGVLGLKKKIRQLKIKNMN